METSIINGEDIRYLVQQSENELTVIMGQMTSLVQSIADLREDTNTKVESIEKQGWFKRMWATVGGKNKATKQEIQRNQDRIISYVSEASAQLYQMNCINQRVMCSLGNRMNQIYLQVTEAYQEQLEMKAQMQNIMAVQQQTLQAMGCFVTKLNEKIESIDNFHMLITEIQQKQYSSSHKLHSLCSILAQLDTRTMEDDRKLDILRNALLQSEIVTPSSRTIKQCLQEVMNLSEDQVGIVYLELCNFRSSFPANLFAQMIETYHFLPKMERMSKNKDALIQKILIDYDLDPSAAFSYKDIAESFLENKAASLILPKNITIECNSDGDYNDYDEIDDHTVDDEYDFCIKDYDYILSWAERGNPIAMNDLGLAFWLGEDDEISGLPGIEEDPEMAAHWFLKGAEAGYAWSMQHFADCCRYGTGIQKNYQRAIKWYKKALNDEDVAIFAKAALSDMYCWGLGTNTDYQKAYEYILDIEDTDAYNDDNMCDHAIILLNGLGGAAQDPERAIELFEESDTHIASSYLYAYGFVRGYTSTAASLRKRKTLWQQKSKEFPQMISIIQADFRDSIEYDDDGEEIDAFDYVDDTDLESFWDYFAFLQEIGDYEFLKKINES